MSDTVGWGNAPDNTAVNYITKCEIFLKDEDLFAKFRSDKDYGMILSGGEYVVGDIALNEIHEMQMKDYLNQNIDLLKLMDSIGGPQLHDYEDSYCVSPSSLRYFSLICRIKKSFKTKADSVVEIGGGFGGFALLYALIFKPKKYYIVDLPEPLALCRKFLSHFKTDATDFIFIRADELDSVNTESEYDFFISDSAFSECSLVIQNRYNELFIKRSKFGVIVWNTFYLENGIKEFKNIIYKLLLINKINIDSHLLNLRGIYIYFSNVEKLSPYFFTKFNIISIEILKNFNHIQNKFKNYLSN